MKVAVSSLGDDLDAEASPKFGRCPMFLLIDTESLHFEAIRNPAQHASSGAGVRAAQLIAGTNARAVITGEVGPKAVRVLRSADLPVYIFRSGTIRSVLEDFVAGELETGAGNPKSSAASPLGGKRSTRRIAGRSDPGNDKGSAQMGAAVNEIRRSNNMRIAISVDQDQGLGSVVSHHFGRCPYYVFADLDEREVKNVTTVANPFFQRHQPGQVPGFIHEQGAHVIITGGMGRRAIMFFQEYDIEPVTGAFGTVSQVLEKYIEGGLTGAQACRESIDHAET